MAWYPNFQLYILYSVNFGINIFTRCGKERSGSVVECLTRDRKATGSSLTGVTALCP